MSSEEYDFSKLTAAAWIITEPGILWWQGTSIDIICDFSGPPLYYIRYNGKAMAVSYDLNMAKMIAMRLSADMIKMGMEP